MFGVDTSFPTNLLADETLRRCNFVLGFVNDISPTTQMLLFFPKKNYGCSLGLLLDIMKLFNSLSNEKLYNVKITYFFIYTSTILKRRNAQQYSIANYIDIYTKILDRNITSREVGLGKAEG